MQKNNGQAIELAADVCHRATLRRKDYFVRNAAGMHGQFSANEVSLNMDYQAFKKLKAKQQIDYVYHYCNLVDFCVVQEKYQQYGMCLYYNGNIFIEVCFDGMRGDRIKNIRVYTRIQQLTHWYERINLGSLLSQKEI